MCCFAYLGAATLGTVHYPTLVKGLVTKGLFVWSVACGAAHTAVATRIEVMSPPSRCNDAGTR